MRFDTNLPGTVREPIETQIDRLFDEALWAVGWKSDHWVPPCNVYEDDEGFCIQMAVPGCSAQDLEIITEGSTLTVKGERKEPESENGRCYRAREIEWGPFSRSFMVPSSVDAARASASLNQGLLSVRFPKRDEAKPRRVLIESR